jgi:hypothetical protein
MRHQSAWWATFEASSDAASHKPNNKNSCDPCQEFFSRRTSKGFAAIFQWTKLPTSGPRHAFLLPQPIELELQAGSRTP